MTDEYSHITAKALSEARSATHDERVAAALAKERESTYASIVAANTKGGGFSYFSTLCKELRDELKSKGFNVYDTDKIWVVAW